jgi:ABC-type Fe3+-hydroxamate transport system substrate-binding protein
MGRLCLAGLLLLASFSGHALVVQDDAGGRISLPAPAVRMVALSPHITDLLLALGARTQIVGVVDDHEHSGKNALSLTGLPVVADANSVNEERLLALKPDLLLVWQSGMSAQRVQRLRELGFSVVLIEPKTLTGIADDISLLGQLSGHAQAGRQQAEALRQELDGLRQRYGPGKRLRAFYEVWLQPLYTLQGGHLVSQALSLCGADSIMPVSKVAAPLVNVEFVLQANPDVIVFGRGGEADSRRYWQGFPALRAVGQGHLLAVDSHRLDRPGADMVHAVGELCAQLEPWRH